MADNALTRAAGGKRRNPLLDFLQSASNAVAQNVSGPVDLIGAGLRFAGVPVPENAVGSSQWLAERGLTAEVPMGPARILGETAGMVGPIAGAQFAPQIAAWRNMVNERLAPGAPGKIPTSIPRGAIVWHGSPHKFDKFDSTKIGTGEGAQAYGHGLYLAESPDVARNYQNQLAKSQFTVGDKTIGPADLSESIWKSSGNDSPEFLRGVMDAVHEMTATGKAPKPPSDLTSWVGYGPMAQRQGYAYAAKQLKEAKANAGSLYKVDLPESAIARMLDWDKPLSQQAPGVQAALEKAMRARGFSDQQIANMRVVDHSGEKLHAFLGGINGQTTGADVMRGSGIPGIRYLDGGSRGAGAGTSNYVVFPGEENILTILARNGEAVK